MNFHEFVKQVDKAILDAGLKREDVEIDLIYTSDVDDLDIEVSTVMGTHYLRIL